MTLAAAALGSTQPSVLLSVPVIILGTDAQLAAHPATPVQLAHACLRAGYASVIPASWGDELVAAAVVRRAARFGDRPAVQCSCPFVAHRLLNVGADLRDALVALVPPPVAVARYVRAASAPLQTRITYVGACPGATDSSIDVRMTPGAFLELLAERDIVLEEQPRVFESVIPPDRRRYSSQPGGLPAAELLWDGSEARSIAEIEGEDVASEIAQLLLAGRKVLIDVAPRLGCVCSGASAGKQAAEARAAMTAIEPPRASAPVVDERVPVDLDLPLPAAARTPVEVFAVPASPQLATVATNGNRASHSDVVPADRVSPLRGTTGPGEARSRSSAPSAGRTSPGPVTVTREAGGKALPRAYVIRRRMSPRSLSAAAPSAEVTRPAAAEVVIPAAPAAAAMTAAADGPNPAAADLSRPAAADASTPVTSTASAPRIAEWAPPRVMAPAWWASLAPRRQLVVIAVTTILVLLTISTIIGVIVGRALGSAPPAASSMQRVPRL